MVSFITHEVPAKQNQTILVEIFTATGKISDRYGIIERTHNGDAIGDHAGIWWNETNELTDYDGVLFLTKGMIKTIEKAGITVSEIFRF